MRSTVQSTRRMRLTVKRPSTKGLPSLLSIAVVQQHLSLHVFPSAPAYLLFGWMLVLTQGATGTQACSPSCTPT